MITFAVLTGTMPKLGVILVAILAAGAMLAVSDRTRAAGMLGALILAPVLLLIDIWHSPQLSVVHRHPLVAVVGALLAILVLAAVALSFNRRPSLLGPLAVVAMPFRVPIAAGGSTANLLVPLYLVVAAGALSFIVPALRGRGGGERNPRGWPERLLALYVVLYAVQAMYSPDFEKALQQMVFFYVPFSLLFCLLRRLPWTSELVRTCLKVVVVLALLFAGVGFVEYATKSIILNPKLVAANDVHAYFTVNSVFFDPDIFGRFLALVMIAVAVLLLYERERREQLVAIAVLAILWVGLVLTLSRSSLAALLVGLGAMAALRWHVGRVLVLAAAVVAVGAAAVAVSPTTFGLNQGLNGASSGRANLVTGGIHMFGDRPLWGYGSGSFVHEYRVQHPGSSQTLSASHTISVTIGAEQGLVGELPYIALVIVSAVALLRGARSEPARAAIAAAFLALMFHTMLYADFLEDPVTWTLLAIGLALARAGRPPRGSRPPAADRAQAVPA
ncbi:MAG: O-antigen ligase family protein [Solirubrobacteraceae bacterium]